MLFLKSQNPEDKKIHRAYSVNRNTIHQNTRERMTSPTRQLTNSLDKRALYTSNLESKPSPIPNTKLFSYTVVPYITKSETRN